MTVTELLYVGEDAQTIAALVSSGDDTGVCIAATPADALDRLEAGGFDALVVDDSLDDPGEFVQTATHRSPPLSVLVTPPHAETLSDELYDELYVVDDRLELETLTTTEGSQLSKSAAKPSASESDTETTRSISDRQMAHGFVSSDTIENSAFAQTILNDLPDILFIAQIDGTLLRWNDRLNTVSGYSDDAIRRMYPTDFFVEDDAQKVEQGIAKLSTTDSVTVTARLLTKDGETIPYEITASPVEFDNGQLGICGVGRDITERRKAQEQLERSNTELEQFAYVASHDMKEPLRMVSSYLELLERRYAANLDDDAQEFIDFAVEGADRMREMINGLLAYSRVGRQTQNFERVDIDEVIETAQSNLRIAIEESDAIIESGELPDVSGDFGQLTQLFQNLIANAIKYTDEGRPTVSISATHEDGCWEFAVSDSGIGIPEERQENVFEIFSGEGGQSSSGIGLAICEKIVGHHGGRIWVDSTVGEGSTFRFTLPEADDSDERVADD